jgi:hypothetical protein
MSPEILPEIMSPEISQHRQRSAEGDGTETGKIKDAVKTAKDHFFRFVGIWVRLSSRAELVTFR